MIMSKSTNKGHTNRPRNIRTEGEVREQDIEWLWFIDTRQQKSV
jgi:hypothetical protein